MTWRYRFALFFFFTIFLLILSRLFYWQVVRAEELSSMGESQYGRSIKLIPERGEIKTSDGFPIAANKITYLTFANPKEIKEKEKAAILLSQSLSLDVATVSANLALDRFWVALKSGVDGKTKEKIEKLDLPGVGFEKHTVRFYPEASLAAKLLGFVGKNDDGEDTGYFGLEGYYDRQLRGKFGRAAVVNDAYGRPILAKMNNRSSEINGRNLMLHVDRSIQFILEKELLSGVERYGALGGMAAVMDPKTGSILAMASYPSFDQGNYSDYPTEYYTNPLISYSYEPGSTFKPLVMAAAIDSHAVKPETVCTTCGAPVQIGEYQIKTWNDEYKDDLTMSEAIQLSDNTGMVYAAQKMGLDRMLQYFKKYGIGEVTGIDLQGEMAPEVRAKDSWYPIDLATASFGQGISVTPIELLSAFSSIANDGIRMEPHVVAAVEEGDEIIKIPKKELGRTISASTAKVMTEILVKAVQRGEAKWAAPKGYRIAGKTGTAQIPIAGHYDAEKTIPSFIGFAPADDPKFVALVVLDRPTTSIYGSETAAPIFFEVAKKILTYYNIPPSE